MRTMNSFFTLLFLFCINTAFPTKDTLKNKRVDSLICLEINGRISTVDEPQIDFYTVELIDGNTVVDITRKKDKRAFKFQLEKDKYYAIRIVKEGYAPKLISINTQIPDKKYSDELFVFSFETELFTEEEYKVLDKDSQDFPITIIAFNDQKKVFDYNEKYTWNIKKCLLRGIVYE